MDTQKLHTVPNPVIFFQLKQMLDKIILGCPSGEVRNKLTEANILLLQAENLSLQGNKGERK